MTSRILTFEGTSNKNLFDMTVPIEAGQTLTLKHARFEITYAGSAFPRMVNCEIGTVVGTDFVIDSDAGYNYFKTILAFDPVDVAGVIRNISVTYPDIKFSMSGRLNKVINFNLYDSAHAPLGGLIYFALQFTVE